MKNAQNCARFTNIVDYQPFFRGFFRFFTFISNKYADFCPKMRNFWPFRLSDCYRRPTKWPKLGVWMNIYVTAFEKRSYFYNFGAKYPINIRKTVFYAPGFLLSVEFGVIYGVETA